MSDTRQIALQKELKQLQAINTAISSLTSTIQLTKTNIAKTNETTRNSDKLLDKWIKILSQTHFTQEIILKTHWTGSSGISDEELDKKIEEEKELLKNLEELENENQLLEEKIKEKESKENQDFQRKQELLSRRERELGLRGIPRSVAGRDRRR